MRRAACGALAALVILPATALGTPHQAHWHYMVGARAGAAMNFAKQLWWEASQPGELHVELAHANAVDLAVLAREVDAWAAATAAVSPSEELGQVESELAFMQGEAQRLAGRAEELSETIARILAAPPDAEEMAALRSSVAEDAAGLFRGFRGILGAHKRAERALGIPVPGEPPDPDGL